MPATRRQLAASTTSSCSTSAAGASTRLRLAAWWFTVSLQTSFEKLAYPRSRNDCSRQLRRWRSTWDCRREHLVRACSVDDVAPESAIPVEVPRNGSRLELAIVHSNGAFYAIADECSHASIPLSEGDVGDGEIECYLHGCAFDLRTGEPIGACGGASPDPTSASSRVTMS